MKKKEIILIIIILISVLLFTAYRVKKSQENKIPEEIKVIDNIDKYGYNLYENKTLTYKNKFNELKDVLNSEEIDEEKYAKILSELFVIDFYDLKSKVTNTDVGGIDFILEDIREEFSLAAENSIYKYIESNVYGERNQELPSVNNTEIVSLEIINFESEKIKDENAYEIEIKIEYEKDLEYPTNVKITLVHVDNDNKLYIVEVK